MSLTLSEHSVIGGHQYYLIIVSDEGTAREWRKKRRTKRNIQENENDTNSANIYLVTLNCIARYSELLEFRDVHPNLSTLPFPPKLFPLFSPSPSELSQRRTQLEV